MNMWGKNTVIGAVILGAVTCGGLIAGSPTAKNEIVEIKAVETEGYIVRLEGNFVNVYQKTAQGETYTNTVNDVNVFDLPETVTQNLKKGIIVSSYEEIAKLTEEWSS